MDPNELYQELILSHSKRPRNQGTLPDATAQAHGDNPSCGDEVELYIKTNAEDRIEEIAFQGQGCAISQASASLMTVRVKGKTTAEASSMIDAFQSMLTEKQEQPPPEFLGDLRILKGVRQYPQRVKCATLAWQALRQCIESNNSTNQPPAG